jgi:hypothetical protein
MALYLNVQRLNPIICNIQTNEYKFDANRQQEKPSDAVRLTKVEGRQNSAIKTSVAVQ